MSAPTPGQKFFRDHIRTDQLGVEVGPWFHPAAPKVLGYNCLILDIWGHAELVARATADTSIPREAIANIEDVDLVGSACDLLELLQSRDLVGKVDYIIGSHTIEHIPDPVRFLRSASQLLRPGGSLLLAVPDARACFDYFRPHSTTTDVLVAYEEKRTRPTLQQLIDTHALSARWNGSGAFSLQTPWHEIQANRSLEQSYAALRAHVASPPQAYLDVHCWIFVPASFELILRDLSFLGLVPLEIDFISEPVGSEFFVRLLKPRTPQTVAPDSFYTLRDHLLHETQRQRAVPHISTNSHQPAAPAAPPTPTPTPRFQDEDDCACIAASGLFDPAYYVADNPDIAAAGVDPLLHYVLYGWREHRNPSTDFSTANYLAADPALAASGLNPLVHYIRYGIAEGRSPKPAGEVTALGGGTESKGGILDCYASTAPSDQNAVDIFAGEWSTRLPGLASGSIELINDDRVIWGCNTLGGVHGQRVLELGPLEGAHTYSLLQTMGCREVVAVEANSRAYLKCLVVKELLGMASARFHYGDCIKFLENTKERFDLIFASGILYHMREPLKLLHLIAEHTDRCVIWTHYYDDAVIQGRPEQKGRFSPAGTTSWGGLTYPVWRFEYQEALGSKLFCGGSAPYALWLERQTILDVLKHLGFTRIEINHDMPHPNGPAFTLAISKA